MISILTPTIRPKGLEIIQACLKKQTFKDWEWLVEVDLGEKYNLNQAWNKMLRRAKGELVVFWQDYIKVNDNALEVFWKHHQENPLVFRTAAVGKSKFFEFSDPKWDWRNIKHGPVPYDHWEIDWGSAPLSALKLIGGFDEELDNYWSCDSVNTGYRAYLDGFSFECIDNPAVAWDHDAFIPNPLRQLYNPSFNNERMNEFQGGLRIDYLK